VRYSRQELKQDRFQETAAGAVHWSVEHRDKLTGLIIAAIVVAAIVAGAFWYNTYRGEQASTALGQAMQLNSAPVVPKGSVGPQVVSFTTSQERSIAAKNAFYEVSSKYGSTKAGKYARYMAGICEQDLGNTKVAEENFKAVADNRDANVSNLAGFALASLYRNTNRESDAVNVYKDLIEHPSDSVPKTTAQFELAEVYSAKQPDEAKKLYAQIQKDNAKSVAGEIAGQRLSSMK